ncbi:restriction endonuclease subunit S [Shewanella sp. AC34-MNA-CIBAN-0136]|uniref:restriction endonuclease subunit S n=1 Tax=Shewanella sp. AC34-MNA-CIBAN-0136 TaxID=3140463 RepID=UPI0033288892
MSVEKNVPQIRFKGLSGEWATSEIAKLALFNPKEELPECFKYVDLESVKGTSLIGYRLELREHAPSRAQRLAKKGDVFFQTVRPYQKNNYLFNNVDNDYVFSTGYAQLRPYCDSKFLLNLIQLDSFVKDVLDNCTGTSYPAINATILAGLEVSYPYIDEEQTQIGNYFQKIESLINQHQQKHHKLCNIKKAMLERMFPKQGQTTPEIRFKGVRGAWEAKTLGDLTIFRRGSFPQPYGNKEWYGGEGSMPFVQVVDVSKELSLVENTKQKISLKAQPLSVFVPKGSVVVTLQGTIGRVAITQYDSFFDRTILIFQSFSKNTDVSFWAYTIQNKFDLEKKRAPGGTIKTITKDALSSFEVLIPSIEEQTAIGNYFQKLDALINQHQQQITKLSNIKQACLSKMFV